MQKAQYMVVKQYGFLEILIDWVYWIFQTVAWLIEMELVYDWKGTSLTVSHCYFLNNQDGILAGDNPASDVVIEYTEFSHNGAGMDSHNLYINHLCSLYI